MGAHDRHQFRFADGLRGGAALQVLLLHYASVFLPFYAHEGAVARYEFERWLATSPLYLVIDGGTAVCLFFVISGFVLASSFARMSASISAAAVKRTVRLALPVAAAAFFAWLCLGPLAPPMDALRVATQSDFVMRVYPHPLTILHALKDVSMHALFTGYEAVSLFSGNSWMSLPRLDESVDPPFWTLHIEFWGSMLVLGLSWARRRLPSIVMGVLLAVAFWLAGTSWYLLFIIGFLLHGAHSKIGLPSGWMSAVTGVLVVAVGCSIAVTKSNPYVHAAFEVLVPLVHGQALNTYTFQSCIGGALIFIGVWVAKPLRMLATSRAALFLGRLSFGMYLLHFPILFAVASRIFLALLPQGFGIAALTASFVGICVTGCLAYLFDRFVDPRIIRLSHRAGALAGPRS